MLAEDSHADVRLIREAMKNSCIQFNFNVATDGEEALAFLRRQGKYAAAPRVDLVLLDLNMPRKDGREVLREMKNDPSLALIPVVVFTTSDSENDIVASYKLHANAYVTKPFEIEQFGSALKIIEDFWMRLAKLPPHHN